MDSAFVWALTVSSGLQVMLRTEYYVQWKQFESEDLREGVRPVPYSFHLFVVGVTQTTVLFLVFWALNQLTTL